MKKLPLIFTALVAIGCGALAFVEYLKISELQLSLAALSHSTEAQVSQGTKDHVELEKVRAQNVVYQNESEDLRKTIATRGVAKPAAVSGTLSEESAAAVEPKPESKKGPGDFMKGMAKMFSDPEMKKVMRGQQSMAVRMMYGDLAKELGLSTEEAAQAMELLTDRQMAISAKSMEAFGEGGTDPQKLEEVGKTVAASRDEYDQQLKGMLGDERMKKLSDYESTVGDRMQLQQMQQMGMKLEEPQRQGLLSIMKEERLKTPPNPFEPNNKDVGAQLKAMQSDEAFDKAFESSKDFNQRVFARAHTVLSPDQMNEYEKAQKQQSDMMQMGMKMGRAMFSGGDKKAAPPTPVPTEVQSAK